MSTPARSMSRDGEAGRVVLRLLEPRLGDAPQLPRTHARRQPGAEAVAVDQPVAAAGSCRRPSSRSPLHQLRLVLAALQGPPRYEIHPRLDDEHCAHPLADRLGEPRRAVASRASSTATGSGGSCFTPRRSGGRGRGRSSPGKPLTTSRTADGKTLTPRTMSMSSVRPMQRIARAGAAARARARAYVDVVARAEAQQRRGAVAEVRQHELARRRRPPAASAAPVAGSISSGVDEPARAEVHAVLLLALAPQRHADVADAHRLGHPRAPARLQLGAEGGLAAAGLARDEHPLTLDSRRSARSEGSAAYEGVRTTASGRSSSIAASRRSVFPVPTGMCVRPIRSNDGERGAGDERARVVGRHDALARRDPGGRVAPRRAGDPVVEVACGEWDVARRRRSCRSSSRCGRSPRGSAQRCVPIGFSGVVVARSSSLPVSGRWAMSSSAPASRAEPPELGAVERRALEQVGELRAVRGRVGGELLVPGPRLDERARASLRRAVLDGVFGRGRHGEPERVLPLLGEVREQARSAGEDRHRLHRRAG